MRLGIDLGGTKISAVVLDDDGREVWRTRVATPRGDYAGTIGAIGGLVEQAEQAVGARCTVGLGIPGAPSRVTGRIKNANSSWLNDQPLHQDLEQRLNRPVRLANDANCLVLSEVADGAAAGARTVFGVILGTGVGGGLFVNGALVEGVNAIGGEWGHNPLPWPDASEMHGDACYCGRSGCIETWLSGPGRRATTRAPVENWSRAKRSWRAPASARRVPATRWPGGKRASRGPWPRSSTLLIRM